MKLRIFHQTRPSSMEKQVTAERDRRAILATSEGDKQSRINKSEGRKMGNDQPL